MERVRLSAGVPEGYANALLLRERGVQLEVIAGLLDVPEDSIASFLRVGEAKLGRLLAEARAQTMEGHQC